MPTREPNPAAAPPRSASLFRPAVSFCVLALCVLLLVRAFVVDVYEVSTGSMAPALVGRHRAADCPHCGARVRVGQEPAPRTGRARDRHAYCWNCGGEVDLNGTPVRAGDCLLVSRAAPLQAPRRWQVVVLRMFGVVVIKRVIGLPGETVAIKGGDIFIDGELCRKSLAECRALRIPLLNLGYSRASGDAEKAWPASPDGRKHPLVGSELHLDDTADAQFAAAASWENYSPAAGKSFPLQDEYCYNGGRSLPVELVHDFSLACDVQAAGEAGSVRISLCDGADRVVAVLPVGGRVPRGGRLFTMPASAASCADAGNVTPGKVLPLPPEMILRPGERTSVEMGFVDRRACLSVNGRAFSFDLPPVASRAGVSRPVSFAVEGCRATLRSVELYRDVHFTQSGRHGVGGKAVRLGRGQYFVLGDNSAVSEDSRFWPDGGAVPADRLIGLPVTVLPRADP